ncbi:MAG: restriction endonuclease subunit S [Rhodocyclales bacterium]|nr:restriction endonuclease subunit S [Rhodocyclales bacterium]
MTTGWEDVTIGDVCTKPQYGWTTKARTEGGDVRLLRTTDITSGRIEWSSVPFCTEAPPDIEKYLLRENDIVISRAGSVGVSHLISNVEPAVFASYLIRFRPGPRIRPRYLAYFLKSPAYWKQIADNTSGIAIPNVNASKLREVSLPLAPLGQQDQIVAEIEKQFSRLDEAVAGLQRVKANLKRYKAAVLKSAVAGRLVPTEADLARREGRNYETGTQLLRRILETRRSQWQGKGKYKEPAAPDTNNLPELPEGWVWTSPDTLAAPVAESIGAGPFGTIFKAKDFRPFGVPIIFLRHVAPGRYLTHKPGFMDRTKWEELFVPYSVFGGELLVTKLGEPPGACAIYPTGIGPAMVTPDVIKMAADESLVAPEFLMNYFNSEIARRFSTGAAFGTTRLRLTLPIFRSIPVPLPPIPEQHRIVAEVERLLSIAREAEAEVDANLKRAQGLRQAILQRAFCA